MHQDTGSFVEFPERDGILHRLRAMEVYQTSMEGVFHLAADRLANRAYDRSAFVFILLELIYELPEDTISFGDLLGRMVFALSQDLDLVGEALEAFEEIRETLQPEPADDPIDLPPDDEAAAPSEPAIPTAIAGATNGRSTSTATASDETVDQPAESAAASSDSVDRETRHEHLMTALQSTQKEVLDAGLATRASIEQTLARPTRSNVRQTLGEIESLRTDLLRFEDLLRQSERQILEAIGVLD